MSERPLVLIAGALTGRPKVKVAIVQESIARRWRHSGPTPQVEPAESRDIIPLLDGWIRRLEREAGTELAQTR
jgi:hypothetical protein